MKHSVYNLSILAGLGLILAGGWLQFGLGAGLIIVGAAVIGITLFTAHVATKSG
jgi:hypothetical protein